MRKLAASVVWVCGVLAAIHGSLFGQTFPAATAPGSFVAVEHGMLPIVISAPHGGRLPIPGVAERTTGTTVLDTNTEELARELQKQLAARSGKKAYMVVGLASRRYVDFNRPPAEAYESPAVAPVYAAYHAALKQAVAASTSAGSPAILVDLHGQGANPEAIFRGTRNGVTATLSTLYAKPDGLMARLTSDNVRIEPPTMDGAETPAYLGGYIVFTYGSSTSAMQAVQLEFGLSYRQSASAREQIATKLAQALLK